MRGTAHTASELPPDTRALIALLFERLDAAVGKWRLEFEAKDGIPTRWVRHEGPKPASELGRFDRT